MARKIVVFSDGTGNSSAALWRTNVWRTFDAIDLSGSDQVAFYDAGIASFLSPDADKRREAAIAKRLDQQDRRLARLERDAGIGVETLALFIRFRLNTTPSLPEPAAKATRAQAGARYDNFVATLGRRLNEGPKLRQEIPDDADTQMPQGNR
jgi:hypothetical protein